ncbi:hypothetical protein [Leucobacter sp. PH1c]|uniref:hypothetical protein n=1 Tax=Leucobacter sp. PH1c TaxID=1397278 RepID=UPI00046A90A2|nr:hypothetical protein [Leucobacter sp. PH1c]
MTEQTAAERSNVRRYTWQMAAAAALYVGLIVGGGALADSDSPAGAVLELLPIIPVVWMLLAALRFVRGLDEYLRPLMMTAAGVGFVAAMLAAVVLGMIEGVVGGIPHLVWGVFVTGMSAWGLAAMVLTRRGAR